MLRQPVLTSVSLQTGIMASRPTYSIWLDAAEGNQHTLLSDDSQADR